MVLLLICSALISASEVAYFGLTHADREALESSKSRKARMAVSLLCQPKRLLATILISNNFVNVAIIIMSTLLTDATLGGTDLSETAQFLIQVVGVTLILLLFGEVIPKVYATRNASSMVLFMSLPLSALKVVFGPPAKLLMSSTNLIEKRIKASGGSISVGELEHALELTSNHDDTNENEQRILEGIVKFGNTDVKQIMTPRLDVTALNIEDSFQQVIAAIIDSGFSRVPVFENNFDSIKGVLYAKDLLPHLEETDDFDWKILLRQPYFVPESKKIDDLLKEFQERKMHLAVVVDEYGGSSGIVTLEDILEEIVGDITDEFDTDDLVYSRLDDCNFVFEGKTPLVDLYRVLEIDGDEFEEEKGESDTLAGFVMELSGKILRKNERVQFGAYTFTAESADKRRIKRIKVSIKQEENIKENS